MIYLCMTSLYFEYEKNKVIQALRYHFISRKEIKFMIVIVNVFAIISAVLFFLKFISPLAFLLSSFMWFSLMVAFWFLLPQMVYKKSNMYAGRFRAVLQETLFTIENERGSKSWQWKEFADTLESPHYFHLYLDSRTFLIVPKEAFEDLSSARQMILQKTGKK